MVVKAGQKRRIRDLVKGLWIQLGTNKRIILTLLDCVFGIMLRVTNTIRAIHPLEREKEGQEIIRIKSILR